MRIISGTCKGRPLKAVPGMKTRPTTDKMKETIFNMIGPYFSGGVGLDLFAGSGGLGLEALSRGLNLVIFVDKESLAIQTIHSNIAVCDYGDQSEVYRNDAERALKALKKREMRFDFVFLDPPYKKQKLLLLLSFIDQHGLMKENGTIVCEHSSDVELPSRIGSLERVRSGEYGEIGLTIYRWTVGDNEEGQP